ncbi:winged helix-turn-helix domain-containing protein [Nitrososphaera sp.]|uniref:winged helix-turn-helix domain-containing protein n=1 Tax=Nitrososphaera sp. TaxID=1971748 RepID=UPI00307F80A7
MEPGHNTELALEGSQSPPDVDLKLKALSNRFRRFLLGLVYANEKMHPSDIAKHVQADSNFVAYHLNILTEANLLKKSYERHGNRLSEYMVTEDGRKFLDFIGASEKLKEMTTITAAKAADESSVPRAKAKAERYGLGRKEYAKVSKSGSSDLKKKKRLPKKLKA